MDESRAARLAEVVLRCYPARWRRRHGEEAAELAVLLIRDGTPAGSVAWSYLAGAAREQKAFFTWHDVREGDIVVFSEPPLDHCAGPQGGDLVKRVIALPGQTVYSSGNSIYVNGRLLAEPYLPHDDPLGPPVPHASPQHPYRVPPGEFYMLGDNRAISCDSRYWGPIKGSSIIGKVVLVWWHNSHPEFHGF